MGWFKRRIFSFLANFRVITVLMRLTDQMSRDRKQCMECLRAQLGLFARTSCYLYHDEQCIQFKEVFSSTKYCCNTICLILYYSTQYRRSYWILFPNVLCGRFFELKNRKSVELHFTLVLHSVNGVAFAKKWWYLSRKRIITCNI